MMYSAVIIKPKRNVFAILDIGTTKIICLIVKINSNFSCKVVGAGYKTAEGISGGSVTNVKHASYSISSTIDLAEQVSEEIVDQIYVNVAGCNVSSFNICNEIISASHRISDQDIKRVIFQTFEKYVEGNVIVHNIPLRYHLDDMSDIKEVGGLYGKKLSADLNVVTASRPALTNIENCITDSGGLNMSGCTVSSYSAGLACLTEDEKELGTAIIDIGGGCTSIGIFKRGKLVYANSIPIGGIDITRDIAYGLCTSIENAERIKILYGSTIVTSIDENERITIQNNENDDSVQVLKSEFINIIRPRVEEVLEIIREELNAQKDPVNKVVFTGGSSQLASMKEIATYILNRQIRIGRPISINGLESEYNQNPIFSASIGSIKLIIDTFYKNDSNILGQGNKISNFYNWIRSKVTV